MDTLWVNTGAFSQTIKTNLPPEQIVNKITAFAHSHGATVSKVIHNPDGSKELTVKFEK